MKKNPLWLQYQIPICFHSLTGKWIKETTSIDRRSPNYFLNVLRLRDTYLKWPPAALIQFCWLFNSTRQNWTMVIERRRIIVINRHIPHCRTRDRRLDPGAHLTNEITAPIQIGIKLSFFISCFSTSAFTFVFASPPAARSYLISACSLT